MHGQVIYAAGKREGHPASRCPCPGLVPISRRFSTIALCLPFSHPKPVASSDLASPPSHRSVTSRLILVPHRGTCVLRLFLRDETPGEVASFERTRWSWGLFSAFCLPVTDGQVARDHAHVEEELAHGAVGVQFGGRIRCQDTPDRHQSKSRFCLNLQLAPLFHCQVPGS